jgi:hypothetical protein
MTQPPFLLVGTKTEVRIPPRIQNLPKNGKIIPVLSMPPGSGGKETPMELTQKEACFGEK